MPLSIQRLFQILSLHFLTIMMLFLLIGMIKCAAQETRDSLNELKRNALRIYIDCNYCDLDYIHNQITFVNYVRDRNDAQLFILLTTQKMGSGGTEYTLTFIGKQAFVGINDTLIFRTKMAEAEDISRKELVRTMKLGLVRYVARTPLADKLSISYSAPSKAEEIKDKWNYWVFSLSTHGYFNGEQSRKFTSLYGSISANKVTSELKINLSMWGNYNESKFDYGDFIYTSISRGRGASCLIVSSLSDHWSAGGYVSIYSSTYSNTRYSFSEAPAIEYNLYPYSESTRRQLRFLYKVGLAYTRYDKETIYDQEHESLYNHSLLVSYTIKEPWGSAGVSVRGSNYFHDWNKYAVSLFGELSFRLIQGLSLDIDGNVSKTHDQLSLPKGEISEEEVLLQRRQLETQYEYWASVGLSYTFGSIYNNIVNPRFGSGGD